MRAAMVTSLDGPAAVEVFDLPDPTDSSKVVVEVAAEGFLDSGKRAPSSRSSARTLLTGAFDSRLRPDRHSRRLFRLLTPPLPRTYFAKRTAFL